MFYNVLIIFLVISGISQQKIHQDKFAKLLAIDSGKSDLVPTSRVYKAVLINESQELIRLNAVQMPGGYAGDGRFFACSLQLWDKKDAKWVTHHLYSFSNPRSTPRIVQVTVAPGEKLAVCDGLFPEQRGHAGDCARFALSPERGQKPMFFSNVFKIIDNKIDRSDSCKGLSRQTKSMVR